MKSISTQFLLICLSLWTTVWVSSVESRKEKIKLKDIQVLTLKPNHWTTGRRSKAVPQLQCVGGYCDAIKGQAVQCYNRGSDGLDVQWECKTQMNSDYKFGSIDVICEGYDYADDDYVLIGSCGLEYTIESGVDPNHRTSNKEFSSSPYISKPSKGFSFGFIICFVFIIFIIYYSCIRPNRHQRTSDGHQTRAPGGPPPPGFRSDFFDGSDGCSSSSSTGFAGYGNTRSERNPNNGNGFFSGLLTGGTLGYLFGSRNTTNYRDQTSYFERRANPPSFFTGSGTPSAGSSTTTSSGFGGTKRR